MSNTNVLRSFTRPILTQLNKDTRKAVEAQKGQLLLLDDTEAFKKVIEATLGRKVPKQLLDRALAAGKKRALQLQNSYTRTKAGRRRLNTIRTRAPDVLRKEGLKIGENAFVLAAFSSAKSVKDVMAKVILEGVGNVSDDQKLDISEKIHRGHGDAGLAVSQVQLGRAFNKAAKLGLLGDLVENFDAAVQDADIVSADKKAISKQITSMATQYKNVVTANSGALKASYFSIITYQAQIDNQADRVLEQRILRLFRSYIAKPGVADKIFNMKGSSSIADKIENHVIRTLTDGLSANSNVTVVRNQKIRKGAKSAGSVEAKESGTKRSKARLVRKPRKALPRARKGAASQPLQMLAVINRELPETVANNMGAPRLVYRSGRFANSVRLTDVNATAQGFPSFGYTYMRYPYEVFELGSGSPLATSERDPRKIIETSVRELAARFAIGRFYLRRV